MSIYTGEERENRQFMSTRSRREANEYHICQNSAEPNNLESTRSLKTKSYTFQALFLL